MNFKLLLAGLLSGSMAAMAGCSADAASQDPADAEEAEASQDELNANASRLVGAYKGQGSVRPPTFQGLVLESNGTFFADVDTGIRCVRAPCPSNVRLTGKFTATKSYLRLSPLPGEEASSFHGRYRYTLAGKRLSLSRTDLGGAWSNDLEKGASYCATADDCGGQGIIHPMCVGEWTCAAHACGYKCGVTPTNEIWPPTATQLVAESPGGGFTPPPPPGSTCAIGKQKFTLDVATKKLSWELCDWNAQNQPLHLVTGSKTLTAAQMSRVNAAMNGVTINTQQMCGADKPLLTIKVTSPAGEKTYTDAFYSCWGDCRTYVNGIDAVFGALRDASGN
jgi:hypothetical protein